LKDLEFPHENAGKLISVRPQPFGPYSFSARISYFVTIIPSTLAALKKRLDNLIF